MTAETGLSGGGRGSCPEAGQPTTSRSTCHRMVTLLWSQESATHSQFAAHHSLTQHWNKTAQNKAGVAGHSTWTDSSTPVPLSCYRHWHKVEGPSARGHDVVNKVIRIVSYLGQLWLPSVLVHRQGLDELSSVCLHVYSTVNTAKYHNMCMRDLACHNSPQILQDMPQVED